MSKIGYLGIDGQSFSVMTSELTINEIKNDIINNPDVMEQVGDNLQSTLIISSPYSKDSDDHNDTGYVDLIMTDSQSYACNILPFNSYSNNFTVIDTNNGSGRRYIEFNDNAIINKANNITWDKFSYTGIDIHNDTLKTIPEVVKSINVDYSYITGDYNNILRTICTTFCGKKRNDVIINPYKDIDDFIDNNEFDAIKYNSFNITKNGAIIGEGNIYIHHGQYENPDDEGEAYITIYPVVTITIKSSSFVINNGNLYLINSDIDYVSGTMEYIFNWTLPQYMRYLNYYESFLISNSITSKNWGETSRWITGYSDKQFNDLIYNINNGKIYVNSISDITNTLKDIYENDRYVLKSAEIYLNNVEENTEEYIGYCELKGNVISIISNKIRLDVPTLENFTENVNENVINKYNAVIEASSNNQYSFIWKPENKRQIITIDEINEKALPKAPESTIVRTILGFVIPCGVAVTFIHSSIKAFLDHWYLYHREYLQLGEEKIFNSEFDVYHAGKKVGVLTAYPKLLGTDTKPVTIVLEFKTTMVYDENEQIFINNYYSGNVNTYYSLWSMQQQSLLVYERDSNPLTFGQKYGVYVKWTNAFDENTLLTRVINNTEAYVNSSITTKLNNDESGSGSCSGNGFIDNPGENHWGETHPVVNN